jgi:hypothetical protein
MDKVALAATAKNGPSQCVWGECGANCPSGLIPVSESSGNKNPLGIELGCTEGKRNFCCPRHHLRLPGRLGTDHAGLPRVAGG